MPWMSHIMNLSRKHQSNRYRSHFFLRTTDRFPVCNNHGIDSDAFTEGEHAPKCPRCKKIVGKMEEQL